MGQEGSTAARLDKTGEEERGRKLWKRELSEMKEIGK